MKIECIINTLGGWADFVSFITFQMQFKAVQPQQFLNWISIDMNAP